MIIPVSYKYLWNNYIEQGRDYLGQLTARTMGVKLGNSEDAIIWNITFFDIVICLPIHK